MNKHVRTTLINLQYSKNLGHIVRQHNVLFIQLYSNSLVLSHVPSPSNKNIPTTVIFPLCWSKTFTQYFHTHWNILLPVLAMLPWQLIFISQLRFLYSLLPFRAKPLKRDGHFSLFSVYSKICSKVVSLSSRKSVSAPAV